MKTVLSGWTDVLSYPEMLKFLGTQARHHFKRAGDAGRHCLMLLKAEDYAGLVKFDVDYRMDYTAEQFAALRQGLAFFQKLESLDIGVDKEAVALGKFHETEVQCKLTNNFLRSINSGTTLSAHPHVVKLLEGVRRKIKMVLGKAPSLGSLKMTFGPGSTTDIKKTSAAPVEKLASGFQCSSSMLASGRIPEILGHVPHWSEEHASSVTVEFPETKQAFTLPDWEIIPFKFGDGDGEADAALEERLVELEQEQEVENWSLQRIPSQASDTCEATLVHTVPIAVKPGKLICVPKSAKTHRTIMIEPNLNGFVQQGVRRVMESRMKRAGLPVNDQTINQRLAKQGSLDGYLATADLSSASDLICYQLIKQVVPEDWFRLLCLCRSGAVLIDDEVHTLEKFSSMGNACTFPLETLLFWAITVVSTAADGVHPSEVSVFGDDIIVPVKGFTSMTWALNALGFELNKLKSYADGHFRESCGHDYYRGINIRPYYQKKLVSVQSLFSLHNFYMRKGLVDLAATVAKVIPASLRIYGPDGYGDGHLLTLDDDWGYHKPAHLKKGWTGRLFDTFILGSVKKITKYPGDHITPLYTIYASGVSEFHTPNPLEPRGKTLEFAKDGRPLWTYPGSQGYKRVSIYTLS